MKRPQKKSIKGYEGTGIDDEIRIYNKCCDDWEKWLQEIISTINWEDNTWRKLKGW